MFGVQHDLELLKNADMCDLYSGAEGERDMRAMWFVWTALTSGKLNSVDELCGFSVSHTRRGWRLTVRAEMSGARWVAFVTEKTTIGCVRTFARWILEDRVRWHADKFA